MKKLAMALVLLVATGAAADLLVRVDFTVGLDARAVAALGVDVLLAPDGWCLARGDEAGVARLTGQFRCTVLDRDPAAKRYVFVFVRPGFVRARLADPQFAGMTIPEIATACGFADLQRFRSQFVARFGDAPAAFRATR